MSDPNTWHVFEFPRLGPSTPVEQLWSVLDKLKVEHLSNFEPVPTLSQAVVQFLVSLAASPLEWLSEDDGDALREAAASRLSLSGGAAARPPLDRIITVDSKTKVTLHEPGWTADGIGLKTWGASLALARRISVAPETLHGGPIIELGAGTGLCGILAAIKCPQQTVHMTDLPSVYENMSRNAQQSGCKNLTTGVLDWNCPEKSDCGSTKWHVVIAPDPLYSPEAPRAFSQTLRWLGAQVLWLALPLRERYDDLRTELYEVLKSYGWLQLECSEEDGDDDFGPTQYNISVWKSSIVL